MAQQSKQKKQSTTYSGPDRRAAGDRRKARAATPKGDERRDGVERRKVERNINEYTLEPGVLEFINAINDFKSRYQKPFPTWSDIYKVFMSLGYTRSKKD